MHDVARVHAKLAPDTGAGYWSWPVPSPGIGSGVVWGGVRLRERAARRASTRFCVMDVQLVVAVIAALASIAAALVSWNSQRRATAGARAIASVNHRVAALDREEERLRADFVAFLDAVGSVQELHDIGRVLGTGEILAANPRCTRELREAVMDIREWANSKYNPRAAASGTQADSRFDEARVAFQDAVEEIQRDRAEVLAEQ
ncbi:hypothetical protein [Cellulosimicrobium protaetiae]|uniref:Uncharacterized protein n=1 Tax=Cellulosimicrobium protaetiae TaxID=2587808 RepID=A0A6M5UD68_9MICO|nr:hypothetical protein [Cellulosimicrobium protaetiae]QJW36466.1 hypothetical protein FIC82_009935 [Cellulosimicrobium protaetiae]